MQRADVYEWRYDESTQGTTNTCPECDGRVTLNTAETVCDDCGLVLADQAVDTGSEWRTFEDRENRSRTGAPRTPVRHDRGLSTEFGWSTDGTAIHSLQGNGGRSVGFERSTRGRSVGARPSETRCTG